jgi:hypothetical protein
MEDRRGARHHGPPARALRPARVRRPRSASISFDQLRSAEDGYVRARPRGGLKGRRDHDAPNDAGSPGDHRLRHRAPPPDRRPGLPARPGVQRQVVTDPDYHDLDAMIRITSSWETPAEKCWALFYWNHRARRQTTTCCTGWSATTPSAIQRLRAHLCSTVAGLNNTLWDRLGYPSRFWVYLAHTVSGASTTASGTSTTTRWRYLHALRRRHIAGVGTSGRRAPRCLRRQKEADHRSLPLPDGHCPNGFLTGADTLRDLARSTPGERPEVRWYYHNWTAATATSEPPGRGVHPILPSPRRRKSEGLAGERGREVQGRSAFYVPNGARRKGASDTEAANPPRLRGSGTWQSRCRWTGRAAPRPRDGRPGGGAGGPGAERAGLPGEAIQGGDGERHDQPSISAEFVRERPPT